MLKSFNFVANYFAEAPLRNNEEILERSRKELSKFNPYKTGGDYGNFFFEEKEVSSCQFTEAGLTLARGLQKNGYAGSVHLLRSGEEETEVQKGEYIHIVLDEMDFNRPLLTSKDFRLVYVEVARMLEDYGLNLYAPVDKDDERYSCAMHLFLSTEVTNPEEAVQNVLQILGEIRRVVEDYADEI